MSAVFSPCRNYRYTLTRDWDEGSGTVNFIGLNPSIADEIENDPTIRRCIGFAKAWGFQHLCMLNLFAYRATDPKKMMAAPDPIGPDNNGWLIDTINAGSPTVAAWGANGAFKQRETWARDRFPGLQVLRLTNGGHPEHPLYLPGTLRPVPWKT